MRDEVARIKMESFLAHHGISGQKWGIQNGPPYPLDYSDHTSAEKKNLSKYGIKPEKQGENNKQTPENNQETNKNSQQTTQLDLRTAKASDVAKYSNQLTNQQLQQYLNRINMEKQIAALAQAEYEQNHKVKTFVKNTKDKLIDTAVNAVVDSASKTLENQLKKKVSSYINEKLESKN